MGAVEDVVAEREGDAVAADELAADEERLREPFGLGLRRVRDSQADLGASPSSRRNPSCSCGVVITSTSRMPASMSVDSG